MADKRPIITVDVDDSRFQDFLRKFEEYQKALKTLPQDWQAAADAMARAGTGIEQHGDGIDRNTRAIVNLTKHAETLDEIWAAGAGYFAHMRRDSEHITKSVAEIGRHFLSFGRLGGIAGLLGLGGIAGAIAGGLELTRSASALRTRSLSAGVPARQMQALNASFGSYFGDVNGVLTQIAQAQSSLSPAFKALGVPGAANAAPSRAFIEIAQALQAHDRAIPLSQMALDPLVRYGETLGFSLPMQRLLRNLPEGELQRVIGQYHHEVAQTPEMKKALTGFQNLERALSGAATTIENDLVVKLGDAAPPITRLIDAATNLTLKFIDMAAFLGKMIGDQGHAATGAVMGGTTGAIVGGMIGGPVGAVVGGVVGAAAGATALSAGAPPLTPAQRAYNQTEAAAWQKYVQGLPSGPGRTITEAAHNAWIAAYERAHPPPRPQAAIIVPGMPGSSPRLTAGTARFRQYYDFLTKREHLSGAQATAILNNIWAESGGKPGIISDHGTSGGLIQEHGSRFAAMMRAVPNWQTNWQGQLAYAVAEGRLIDPKFFSANFGGNLSDEWQFHDERPKHPVPGSREHFGSDFLKYAGISHAAAAKPDVTLPTVNVTAPREKLHPVAVARAAKGNNVNVHVRSDASANSIVTISQLPVY